MALTLRNWWAVGADVRQIALEPPRMRKWPSAEGVHMPNIKTAWKQTLCERGVGVPRLALLRKHSPNFTASAATQSFLTRRPLTNISKSKS
jgi:hypothetical protein